MSSHVMQGLGDAVRVCTHALVCTSRKAGRGSSSLFFDIANGQKRLLSVK